MATMMVYVDPTGTMCRVCVFMKRCALQLKHISSMVNLILERKDIHNGW